jgi:glycosyltransferase involved in cell wall biosynthesis
MGILFVTPYFPPQTGGVATYVHAIQRRLRERGHEVAVLMPGSSHVLTRVGTPAQGDIFECYLRRPWVPSAPLKGFAGWSLYALPTLSRLATFIRSRRIEVVVLEYPMAYMYYFAILRRILNFRIVVGVHGDDVLSLSKLDAYERFLVRRLIRKADWLVGHSKSLLAETSRIVGEASYRRSCIPYGVESTRLRALVGGIPDARAVCDAPYILTVAKLYSRKGLDVLLDSVRQMGPQAGQRRFVVVGDGPEESRLKEQADALGIADRVVFTGELTFEETARLHERCEFFVLPSRSEPFGIALLEAMTFGKAVVATRVGGIPEFVVHRENGLLVEADDSKGLSAEIVRLIDDSELRSRLGARGRQTVEERYTYDKVISDYEACFRLALTSGASPRRTGG